MDTPIWQYIVSMGMYFLLLLLIIDVMRKHHKFANYFWVASLFTFPLWLMGGVAGWFRWSKTLSILIPIIFFGFTRAANIEKREGKVWKALQQEWPMWILYGVLFLNIAEATMKDFQANNFYNVIAGFILCATIPFPNRKKFWNISKEAPGDVIAYTTLGWNFLYTTWNACFVYGESGVYFASSLCIIIAAEAYPLLKGRPELYITARVYTLATHLLIRACLPNLFPAVMDASTWLNADVLKYWGLANLVFGTAYIFWYMWQLHTGKSDVSFRKSLFKNKAVSA